MIERDLATILGQPLEEKWPPGLFLDGVKLNALGDLLGPKTLPKIANNLGDKFDCYIFPIGQCLLTYYLCPNSRVEIDSNRYLTLQQELDEDIEDMEFCQAVFKDTISQRDTFEGDCLLNNVCIAESHLSSSTLELTSEYNKLHHIYIGLELLQSDAVNVEFSKNVLVMESFLQDVEVVSHTNDKVEVNQCYLHFSKFRTDGQILLDDVNGWNTHINMKGILTLERVSWPKVRITGESIYVPGPMWFLEVPLPRVKFFVYQRAGDHKWAIAPDTRGDRFSVDVDNPHVEDMLREVIKGRGQPDEESCLQYIYDSIASRTKVMEAIERSRHKEYLRLSAVC